MVHHNNEFLIKMMRKIDIARDTDFNTPEDRINAIQWLEDRGLVPQFLANERDVLVSFNFVQSYAKCTEPFPHQEKNSLVW